MIAYAWRSQSSVYVLRSNGVCEKLGEKTDTWEKIGICIPYITLPALFIESIYFLHVAQHNNIMQQDILSHLAQVTPHIADFPTPN